MIAASALIGGLAGEKTRWTEQSKGFKSQIERLVVNHLILCILVVKRERDLKTQLLNV